MVRRRPNTGKKSSDFEIVVHSRSGLSVARGVSQLEGMTAKYAGSLGKYEWPQSVS